MKSLIRSNCTGSSVRRRRNNPAKSTPATAVKAMPTAPLLKTVCSPLHQFIFGKEKLFPTVAALNRHELHERFLADVVQQNQFETILDVNPAKRFANHSAPGFTVRRYARKPDVKIVVKTVADKNDPANSIVTVSAKSRLTAQGHLEPVGNLPSDVWTEDHPACLADLGYAHVYETNKVKESVALPAGLTTEQIAQIETGLQAKVEAKLHQGSPITSTTSNSLIDKYLQTWGDKDSYIEIAADQTNIVSPTYLAALIMFASGDEKMDKPTKNNWRTEYPEPYGPDAHRMEKLLIRHGIEPNGAWTNRERCAYYALAAAEHMLIGATPVGVARIVNRPSL